MILKSVNISSADADHNPASRQSVTGETKEKLPSTESSSTTDTPQSSKNVACVKVVGTEDPSINGDEPRLVGSIVGTKSLVSTAPGATDTLQDVDIDAQIGIYRTLPAVFKRAKI